MNPRLQAGLELQFEKQAHQEHDSSLSGVLGQYFKQASEDAQVPAEAQPKQASAKPGMSMSTMLRGISRI